MIHSGQMKRSILLAFSFFLFACIGCGTSDDPEKELSNEDIEEEGAREVLDAMDDAVVADLTGLSEDEKIEMIEEQKARKDSLLTIYESSPYYNIQTNKELLILVEDMVRQCETCSCDSLNGFLDVFYEDGEEWVSRLYNQNQSAFNPLIIKGQNLIDSCKVGS
jgi:hypothetical protein